MKPGLSLKLSQHLTLTPQLQQSIRLLQLSTLELSQEIEQMLADNPFLELDETPDASSDPHTLEHGLGQADACVSLGDRISEASGAHADDAETPQGDAHTDAMGGVAEGWDGDGSTDVVADDGEWGGEAPALGKHASADEHDPLSWASASADLGAHLRQQALGLRLEPTERAALDFLIGSLNDDGYLDDPLEVLARSLMPEPSGPQWDELLALLQLALHWLQSFEPTGVGARDLAECLRLQCTARLRQAPADSDERIRAAHALALCQHPMLALAKRDTKQLAALTGLGIADVRAAQQWLTRLEPKPARPFASVQRLIVVPDVIVTPVATAQGPDFRVRINPDVMPKLRVHDLYAQALRHSKGESAAGLQQRLQEARWFIKNIQQRFDTMARVASAIVERQKQFLRHGDLAMRPLVLRDIADALGMHESTISRVTTAKYMATPQGTFELKYFFGSGLGTSAGQDASSTAVRALIRQWIAAEDPRRPLSDNRLSDMLQEQGIDCARRTVAKYRDALKIAPTHLRKTL